MWLISGTVERMGVTCLLYNGLGCCYCRLLEAERDGVPRLLDSARVSGELLYPVFPSPMDYFGWESKGHLEWVMGSFGTRYSEADSVDNSCGGGGVE